MASTLTLNSLINWSQAFVGFPNLTVGTNNEPAATTANLLLQTILSPPFCWNWNRAATSLTTVAGTQDYVVSAANFGFIEKASYTDSNSKVSEITQIQGILGSGSEQGTPNYIAPQIDDNAGNITFRLLPVPDAVYTVNIIYQKRQPTLITTGANTLTPLPDHYGYIIEYGFLAMMYAYFGDPRWASFNQKFMAELLGVAEGLSESQRDVFQKAWLDMVSEQQSRGLKVGQGVQSRSA